MKPKIAIVSLGCSKNTVDSENLLSKLYDADFDVIAEAEDADGVIINTCGFIQPAVVESREKISQTLNLKKGKEVKVLAMGCYVSRGTEDWKKNFPALDGIFALKDTNKIIPHLQDLFHFKSSRVDSTHTYDRSIATTLPHYSYLKIAEGCSRRCTFCTIPSIRGDNISKSIDDIKKEAEHLRRRGVRELILIAQDTTAYGLDLYGKPSLAKLLKELALVDGIEWIRLYYAYPDYIDADLIDVLLNEKKILHYLDLPIQHTHPDLLRRMGRQKTFDIYNKLFDILRAADKDYCLRTTVITGFPGETETEFGHMTDYLAERKFDRLGAFKYIREQGTPADRLEGHLAEGVIEKRFEQIMVDQQKNHFKKNESLIGRSIRTIIDQKTYSDSYIGRTYRDAPDIDAAIIVKSTKSLMPGDIIDAEITGMKDYDLIGAY